MSLELIQAAFFDELEKIAKSNIFRALRDPGTRRQMLGWISKTQPEVAGQMMKRHMESTSKMVGGGPGLTHMPAEVLTKRFREASRLPARPPASLEERLAQGVPHKLVGAKASQAAPPGSLKFKTVSKGAKPGPAPAFTPYGTKPKRPSLVPFEQAA